LFSVDKKATSYIILCKDDLPGKNTIQGKDNTLTSRGKNEKGKKRMKWNQKRMEKKNEYNFLPCLDGLKTRRK
jgi:hypothetical protein